MGVQFSPLQRTKASKMDKRDVTKNIYIIDSLSEEVEYKGKKYSFGQVFGNELVVCTINSREMKKLYSSPRPTVLQRGNVILTHYRTQV